MACRKAALKLKRSPWAYLPAEVMHGVESVCKLGYGETRLLIVALWCRQPAATTCSDDAVFEFALPLMAGC